MEMTSDTGLDNADVIGIMRYINAMTIKIGWCEPAVSNNKCDRIIIYTFVFP